MASSSLLTQITLILGFSRSLWMMILLFGIGVGLSFSLSYTAILSATNAWFSGQRAFAVGVGSSGAGIGQAAFNILVYWLCDAYGWSVALWVWAAIAFVFMTPALFFLRVPFAKEPKKKEEASRDEAKAASNSSGGSSISEKKKAACLDLSFFLDPVFVLWFCSLSLASLGYFSPFTHLVKYAQDVGIPEEEAPTLMSVIGISNMIARILTGRLADSYGHLETFAVSMLMAGVSTSLLPLLNSFESLVLYSVFFGYFGGAFVGLYSVVTADYFGIDNLPTAIGVVMCSWCIGSFIGAPMTGWIYDAYGTYTPAWIVCGTCMALSGLSCMFLPYVDAMYPDRLYRPIQERIQDAIDIKVESKGDSESFTSSTRDGGATSTVDVDIVHDDSEFRTRELKKLDPNPNPDSDTVAAGKPAAV